MTRPGTTLSSSMRVDKDFGKMPLYFIANRGQMDGRVAYYVQGKEKTIYFTSEGLTLALNRAVEKDEASRFPESGGGAPGSKNKEIGLRNFDEARPTEDQKIERWVVKLDFVGANPGVKPVSEEKTGAVVSYFKGKKEDWRTGLPTYSKVVYRDLWPGIGLVFSGTINKLKCEFIVHPGADPSKIRMAYRGAESVSIDEAGRLQVTTPRGSFSDDVPVAYQDAEGRRRAVSLSYRLLSESKTDGIIRSADSELVVGSRSHYKGSEHSDYADGCGQDLGRNDFASDTEEAQQFVHGFDSGDYDPNLTLVLDPALLVYCGYIDGSSYDSVCGIAVDGSGNAYVTGETCSTEATFPETVGPDVTFNGGYSDGFIAKVDASGTALVYCGYVGGSSDDFGFGIAIGSSGNAYILGFTRSSESTFPVIVGPDLTHNGGRDAFVAKVYYFEQPVHKHAVGDFDGDGTDEAAIDFGTSGIWMWNGRAWSQLSTNNPENMIPFDIDGNGDDEIAVDLGSLGLWMWNGGVWSQLGANDPEYLIAVDTNNNGVEELIIDFGAAGLKWRQEGGM